MKVLSLPLSAYNLRERVMLVSEYANDVFLLADYFGNCEDLIAELLVANPQDTLALSAKQLLESLKANSSAQNYSCSPAKTLDFLTRAVELDKPTVHSELNSIIHDSCISLVKIGTDTLDWAECSKFPLDPAVEFQIKQVIKVATQTAELIHSPHKHPNFEAYASYIMSCGNSLSAAMTGRGLDRETSDEYWNEMIPLIPNDGSSGAQTIWNIYESETARLHEIKLRCRGIAEAISFEQRTSAKLRLIELRAEAIKGHQDDSYWNIICVREAVVLKRLLDEATSDIQQKLKLEPGTRSVSEAAELARLCAYRDQVSQL